MREMTGAQAMVAQLLAHEVEALFFIPGVQLDWAVEALREQQHRIRLFVPRHEQATTYMADGYARVRGRPGVAMVVPGPGVLNASAGLATAYASNSPVVLIAGQVHSEGVGKGFGMLHEVKDHAKVLEMVTKWNALVLDMKDIPRLVAGAFAAAGSGRLRPAAVEIPYDLLQARAEFPEPGAPQPPASEPLDERSLDAAARLLDAAHLPVIYVGGGVLAGNASDSLRRLAARLRVPVVMSDNARGALSDRDPLAFTTLAGRVIFEKADVVLVVGSRFMDVMTATPSWPMEGKRYIHVNIDAADFAPPRRPEVAILGQADAVLRALGDRVKQRQICSPSLLAEVKRWAQAEFDKISPQAAYIRAMRQALPEDGIFVNELTQVGYLARLAWQVPGPRLYIGPGYQGTLGYGFPTALGAAVAAPGRRVLAITGDGGFGWNLQELATARKYDLRVTLVVFNDRHFGNVRAFQKRQFGAEVGVELRNPDFEVLARAFDVAFERAESPEALGAAVAAGNGIDGPLLVEAPVGEMPNPWTLVRLLPQPGIAATVRMEPNPFPG